MMVLLALHSRLAHVGAGAVGRLQPGLKRNDQLVIQTCPACIQAKMVRRPYLDIPPELKATKPGEVISADVLNPSATSAGGAKYLRDIVYQFTGFIEVYAQKHIHPETGETSLPHFLQVCKNSFGVTVGTLRADAS